MFATRAEVIASRDEVSDLQLADKRTQLHPFTNAHVHSEQGGLLIERGDGVYVIDANGERYLEGMSGLWCVALGFSNKRLAAAAAKQFDVLPYYHQFVNKTMSPCIKLSEKLIEIAPGPMSKVFLANSGSEANDTAVKLVWYFNNAKRRPQKKKIISRKNGYHGVTIASASLTGLPAVHKAFDLPLPGFLHVSCPNVYRDMLPGETEESYADRLAAELENLILEEGPETVAAFFGEPVMGAGGVHIPPATYWEKIQKVCRKYDVLVVADEVITGFGRTGAMFGCDKYGIKPDILVLSKQITSAYQPLSAVLINEHVYEGVADQASAVGAFAHGFTGGGHPVAAAVALENIAIIEEDGLAERAAVLGKRFYTSLQDFQDHPLVGDVRAVGLIGAIELVADKDTKASFDVPGQVGRYLVERAQANGLVVRGIGDVIAFCPPLIISEREIDELISRFAQALEETTQWYYASN
ncbi:aspartate aminotransferase family protein [Pseudomonas sp. v388]|nr:aspartate aminotransferase family protein [Pseudomonas sp. v388]